MGSKDYQHIRRARRKPLLDGAPWAYDAVRLELSQVKAPLDIYPLGKVLWSMISGRNGFSFWEYKIKANNLEVLFPNDRDMPLVNALLAQCVVREEEECLSSASALLDIVEKCIEQVTNNQSHYRPQGAETWPCRMCGRGHYHAVSPVSILGQITGATLTTAFRIVYSCVKAGHAELFKAY